MNKYIITILVIIQIITLSIFFNTNASLEGERNDLLLRVSKLEGELVKSKTQVKVDKAVSLPEVKTIKQNKEEKDIASEDMTKPAEIQGGDETLELDEPPEEKRGYAKMDDVLDIFESDETDSVSSMKYEDNLQDLFDKSDMLSGMGVVSTECRSGVCKVIITRSVKGAFSDATTFSHVLKKQKWGQYNGFRFSVGNEDGLEDYVTFWIKR